MNLAQIDSARQLARLPARAPERCLFQPHRWTEWTLWDAEAFPPLEPMLVRGVPEPQPIMANRDRFCRQCGCTERQSFQGEVQMIADPHQIERRRK